MKTKQCLRAALTCLTMFFYMESSHAVQDEKNLEWPSPLAAKITEILEIKKNAMRLPSMRSENGELGKQAEAAMDQIGTMLTDEAFIKQIRDIQKANIRAKIAVWALDRKERPEEYKRFAKFYVNTTESYDEAIEYFYRPHRNEVPDPFAPKKERHEYVPRPGTWSPNPIDPEDQLEKNRYIFEYCFFMPPTGARFDNDGYRFNFVNSLKYLKNPELSLIVYIEDGKSLLAADENHMEKDDPMSPIIDTNHLSVIALAQITTKESFQALAYFWQFNGTKRAMRLFMSELWAGKWEGAYGSYPQTKIEYDAWMELSRLEWSAPAEKEFAKWLQTVPGPKAPAP